MIGYTSSTQTVSDPWTGHLLHRATGSQGARKGRKLEMVTKLLYRSVYKTLQRLTRPTKELPSPSLVYTPPHWGKEASMGGIFKPWPQAEYHITETTCQKFGNRWTKKKKKKSVWDCTLRNTTFQRGPQHASKFLYRGPLIHIIPPWAAPKSAH